MKDRVATRSERACHHLTVIKDFFTALRDPYSYSIMENPEVLFGFLWGIPVPFFVFFIHVHSAPGHAYTLAEFVNTFVEYPMYILFLIHPLIFAVIFGALGTMREKRDAHIRELLNEAEKQNQELCKANAKLIELDRYKSEFLANVTHELKSPLVTALGYTDRLLGGHLGEINEKQRKGLDVGKRNLQRLRKLIDEILDFSRLDAGVARFQIAPNDLSAAVHAAAEGLALKAKDHNIAIDLALPKQPARVLGDAAKLMQVVINLLDNAIKFSREGGTVKISIVPGGMYWHLTVADSGIGISSRVLPHLFERFVQEDGSLARNYDGIGLGLVIVKKIVDAHGGRVWVESKAGEGTKVHVELHNAECEPPTAADSDAEPTRKEAAHA
jgi:signal transduction histidine kinase